MTRGGLIILMGMGGLFILLGLVVIFLGKKEEKKYYDSLTARPDAREFLEHWPRRPQFGSLTAGGWIAIAVGALMAAMGSAFWLWR